MEFKAYPRLEYGTFILNSAQLNETTLTGTLKHNKHIPKVIEHTQIVRPLIFPVHTHWYQSIIIKELGYTGIV